MLDRAYLIALVASWAAVLVGLFLRPLQDHEVVRWARGADLILTERTWADVRSYLKRARRFRRIGFSLGAGSLVLVMAAVDSPGPLPAFVVLVVPYSAGIVLAELVRRRRPLDGAAALEPRTLDRYLPARLVWLPRLLLVAVGAGSGWSLTMRHLPEGVPPGVGIVAYAATGAALLVAGEVAQRAVVRRRQAVGPPDVVAADDAMRSQSVHAIAGGLVVVLTSLLLPAFSRPAADGVLNPAFDVVAFLGPTVGWPVGIWYQNRAWPVRRRLAPPPPVGTPA